MGTTKILPGLGKPPLSQDDLIKSSATPSQAPVL